MSRPLRIEYEGAWYHVMNRGAGRQAIFHDREHYELFLNLLNEIHNRYHVADLPRHFWQKINTIKVLRDFKPKYVDTKNAENSRILLEIRKIS